MFACFLQINREGVLLLRGLDSRLSKDLPSDLQKLRCKVLRDNIYFSFVIYLCSGTSLSQANQNYRYQNLPCPSLIRVSLGFNHQYHHFQIKPETQILGTQNSLPYLFLWTPGNKHIRCSIHSRVVIELKRRASPLHSNGSLQWREAPSLPRSSHRRF